MTVAAGRSGDQLSIMGGVSMPIYEYKCQQCGKFEVEQRITEPPLAVCPKCGGKELKRLIPRSLVVIYKGSGFHTTDYRSKDFKEKAKAEEKESQGTSGATGESEDIPAP